MTGSATLPSDAQRNAIVRTEGRCMILAGPGSGKTYVLTHRIAHLLQEVGVRPWRVLAVTFTNKAAGEMRDRIGSLVGEGGKGLWVGTFHALFARMLREEAEGIGLPKDFTIYDGEDSKRLVKKVVKELGLREDRYKAGWVLRRMSEAKSRLLLDARGYGEDAACLAEDEERGTPHMARVFAEYGRRCERAGAVDFDDILLRTYYMLQGYPEIAKRHQERFRYVLVDEFQDTNRVQYGILKMLSVLHGNLCVIGDDAQSIYGFRGADVKHMLDFKKDFPEAEVMKLTHNFRSTQHIVKAANGLIGHNQGQLEKVLFTENALGEPLQVVEQGSDVEEAMYVARSIFETSQRGRATLDRFAVLYRTNRQSRLVEEALRRLDIAYRVRGGTSFYTRKEVKDVLAYLRLVVNPNDEQAIERVINLPKRGIGGATLAKVRAWALEEGISFWEGLKRSETILPVRFAKAIKGFTDLMEVYRGKRDKEDAYTLARGLAEASGLLRSLSDGKGVEELSRYEHVQELLTGIAHFVERHAGDGDTSLSAYLQEVSLLTGDEGEEDKPCVTLMTMHAAKGLEYDYVYLVGVEEGIMPSPLMCDSVKGLEEERRLLYVGITRAKLRVTLSYALKRKQFEQYKRSMPSRFLKEIDPSLIHRTRHVPQYGRGNGDRSRAAAARSGARPPMPSPSHLRSLTPLKRHSVLGALASDAARQEGLLAFKGAMEVKHPHFGVGTVLSVTATAHGPRVKVDFGGGNVKTLLAAFAKLTVV